ncbi:MAG: ribonuclease III [Clostridia bacterium]|nr:ribonuclease III [Clostridia bacterium]
MNLPLDISEFESRIGYTFRDKSLIETALTHSSYSNELKVRRIECECNERLEFLGDSVLSIIVSEYLFAHYADRHAEGDLTRMRADVVCERALAGYAAEVGLGQFLKLGRGEDKNNGRERKSILADAFEATLAAMYLDAGENGKAVVSKYLMPFVLRELDAFVGKSGEEVAQDYKTHLQQFIQQSDNEQPEYVTVGESGPDHMKIFEVEVRLNSNVIGKGSGHSKREAEQSAAKQALELFGEI